VCVCVHECVVVQGNILSTQTKTVNTVKSNEYKKMNVLSKHTSRKHHIHKHFIYYTSLRISKEASEDQKPAQSSER
jgi:hypothetical protein